MAVFPKSCVLAIVVVLTAVVSPNAAAAALRRPVVQPVFPRVVREAMVTRLAATVPPVPTLEQQKREYRPRCCFEPTPTSMCRLEGPDEKCWVDAGDGCGPDLAVYTGPPYWPEGVTVSGTRWGETSRDEQRRSIREILRVLAEKQPAKPVGLAAYAFGYIESGFNPTAVHPRTEACGLHQFLRPTWREFARPTAAEDPDACKDPRESAMAAVSFLSRLYESHALEIVERQPDWSQMSEWDQLKVIYLDLYALHNYGQNDARWQDEENPAKQIALSHLGVLKNFYDTLSEQSTRKPPPKRIAHSRGRRSS